MPTETQPIAPRVVLRNDAGRGWVEFTEPSRILVARRRDEVLAVIREVEQATQQEGFYATGFVSYEAGPAFDSSLPAKEGGAFPLAWFGLFKSVQEISKLPVPMGPPIAPDWQASITPGEYRRCFDAIREYIRNGDTYQVNFTYRLRATANIDPWQYFLQAMGAEPAPYAAFVDTGEWAICSASPELFFRLHGDQIESRPMKGTAARGLWFADDQRQAAALGRSEKEGAENVMIADMVRNDLGRVAVPGSVHVPFLFAIEKYPTVWQMTSTVCAQTHAPLDDIFSALFPPSSITGAPKRRTMQIIDELETTPRRVYTGAIGFVQPNRVAQFNVAIRTVLMHRPSQCLEYGVGGGIVWDSDPSKELEECAVKARVLLHRSSDFELLETILWTPQEGYALLEYHMMRLSTSADYFSFAIDVCRIPERLAEQAKRLPAVPHRIRLLAGRDGHPRLEATPLDAAKMQFGDIRLARTPVDRRCALLYHKTTDRRVYEDAIGAIPGCNDVLLFNEEGQITESTIANVAFEMDGAMYTPPLICGLLPGVYRAWLLERHEIKERILTVEEALRLPHIYLMNSVRGMQKVRIISG